MTTENESASQTAMKVLLCGGIAGIITWASVFPLDVVKTKLQAQTGGHFHAAVPSDTRPLLESTARDRRILTSFEIAKRAYQTEGLKTFYRGLGVCSLRAFIVNAVQVCRHPIEESTICLHHCTVGNVRVAYESLQ